MSSCQLVVTFQKLGFLREGKRELPPTQHLTAARTVGEQPCLRYEDTASRQIRIYRQYTSNSAEALLSSQLGRP